MVWNDSYFTTIAINATAHKANSYNTLAICYCTFCVEKHTILGPDSNNNSSTEDDDDNDKNKNILLLWTTCALKYIFFHVPAYVTALIPCYSASHVDVNKYFCITSCPRATNKDKRHYNTEHNNM